MTTQTINAKPGSRSLDDEWRRGPLGHLPRPKIRRRISVIAIEDGEILDVTGPLSTFALVNTQLTEAHPEMPPAYGCDILARSAGSVKTSAGVALVADRAFGGRVGPIDTLIVPGGRKDAVARARSDPHLIAVVRRLAPKVRRLASVCTGTFILAEAGLLEGRTVTTHWSACGRLAEEFPRTTVEPDRIFVRDGSVYTSAGVTAGIDLALGMIEDDLGRDWALTIARRLVVYLKRPGGQSQFSAPLSTQFKDAEILKGTPAWIVANLSGYLSVASLAERAGMSERTFARTFRREMKTTPAKFVEAARLDVARHRLEESALPLETLARDLGFGSSERMRRSFQRQIGIGPDEYRQRWRRSTI